MGVGFVFGVICNTLKIIIIVYNTIKYAKTIELYTLNGGILWHVNYITVKLFLKNNMAG